MKLELLQRTSTRISGLGIFSSFEIAINFIFRNRIFNRIGYLIVSLINEKSIFEDVV